MEQVSSLTRKLAAAQEAHAARKVAIGETVVYRLYTERFENLANITSRYFKGATLFFGEGLYAGNLESSGVIEIVGLRSDLQSIFHLAGDIKHVNNQQAVLVTWGPVSAEVV